MYQKLSPNSEGWEIEDLKWSCTSVDLTVDWLPILMLVFCISFFFFGYINVSILVILWKNNFWECHTWPLHLEKMYIQTTLRSQRLMTSWFYSLRWKWARRRKQSECDLTVHLTSTKLWVLVMYSEQGLRRKWLSDESTMLLYPPK